MTLQQRYRVTVSRKIPVHFLSSDETKKYQRIKKNEDFSTTKNEAKRSG